MPTMSVKDAKVQKFEALVRSRLFLYSMIVADMLTCNLAPHSKIKMPNGPS
jgi:hypothetical protein